MTTLFTGVDCWHSMNKPLTMKMRGRRRRRKEGFKLHPFMLQAPPTTKPFKKRRVREEKEQLPVPHSKLADLR